MEYVKVLEQQNEELQKKLAESLEQLEKATKKLKEYDVSAEDMYVPKQCEIVDGWRIYNIESCPVENRVLIECRKSIKTGIFRKKIIENVYNFVALAKSHNPTTFNLEFYKYPALSEMYGTNTFEQTMFNVARQNGFIYAGDRQGKFRLLAYGIRGNNPEHSIKLCKGAIIKTAI